MQTFATITAQGQLNIPTKILELAGLGKSSKVLIEAEKNKIVIEPVPDLLELAGVFHAKAVKGKSIDEIIALEKRAVEEAVVERYLRKQKS